MGINVQARLRKIEDKLKSMKACYNTAGSLVKMYVQKSEVFTVGGSSSIHDAVFKFTPQYNQGQSNMVNLYPIVKASGVYVKFEPFVQAPQDGSGEIRITIYNVVNTDTLQFIASGTTPGSFTRIS